MKYNRFLLIIVCLSSNIYCLSSISAIGVELGNTVMPVKQNVNPSNNDGARTIKQHQLRKKGNQIGIFIDSEIYKNFGFILGYESSFSKGMDTKASSAAANAINSIKLNKRGGYFLLSLCQKIFKRVSIFAGIGVKRSVISLRVSVVNTDIATGEVDKYEMRFINNKRMIPKVCLGVKYSITENLWLRIAGAWEKSSSFNNLYSVDNLYNDRIIVKLKNSMTYAIGIAYNPF
jgi:hypothetical protein